MLRDALFDAVKADLLPHMPIGCDRNDFESATPRGVASLMLLSSLFKKIRPDSSELQDSAAFELFQAVNDRSGGIEFSTWGNENEEIDFVIGEMQKELYNFFYPKGMPLLSATSILEGFDFGPGASYGSSDNHIVAKLYGPIAGNEFAIAMYAQKCAIHPLWRESEDKRRMKFGVPTVQKHSKLTFVPKTEAISRTICIEPALNMLVQKGIGRLIESRLIEMYGLDFEGGRGLLAQPEVNRALARKGSEDDSFATIDLSSASDTLSLFLYKKVLPKQVYAWLSAARSEGYDSPNGSGVFHMLSTMGNAFTFPMQTLLFTTLVKACYHVRSAKFRKTRARPRPSVTSPMRSDIGNFGIFGDDIICLSNVADLVLLVLKHVGCEPNLSKTFTGGRFRESCGYDAFSGHNVRGVYIKSLKTREDIFVAHNLLSDWSKCRGIPLHKSLTLLRDAVRSQLQYYVPSWEADTAGFKVDLNEVPSRFVRRVIDRSHRSVAFLYKKSEPVKKKIIWEKFDPRVSTPWGPARPYHYVVREIDEMLAEESAYYLAFLRGNLRDGTLLIKDDDHVKYREKTAISSSW